jgi:PAS domain S-box-containing protein
MNSPELNEIPTDQELEILWRDKERTIYRGFRPHGSDPRTAVLAVRPTHSGAHECHERLASEFRFRVHLDEAWAVRPLNYLRDAHTLLLADPGGELLAADTGVPLDFEAFLKLAVALADTVARMHAAGVLHTDIKPSKLLFDRATGAVRITGFGIACNLAQGPAQRLPGDTITGTFAYMAPEQTGRMGLPMDFRSDLYSLGATLYELLTGAPPFSAADATEWIHSHLAKQPMTPSDRRTGIPSQVSAVIMKLLSKSPDDRYQSAAGLRADLEHCLEEWVSHGSIVPFSLGEHDAPAKLRFAPRLFGRHSEMQRLRSAWRRFMATGESQLVLISGYSGIGKSSLVHELRTEIAASGCLFVEGKFDQYQRDIPYATLAQTFRSLLREQLGKPECYLVTLRNRTAAALGGNGQLLLNLLPELELLVGSQPPVAELSGAEARHRFLQIFRKFVGVFARPEHPLVLFLDDLQWLDPATLDVFQSLSIQTDMRHLMLIGAYRSNEVGDGHPLRVSIDAIEAAAIEHMAIQLEGLGVADVQQIVAHALLAHDDHARDLGEYVFDKTGGNPFFAAQFLISLADADLLRFRGAHIGWEWNVGDVRERSVSDNIVDLMIERLGRLPQEALEALQTIACIGSRVDRTKLSQVLGQTDEVIHRRLRDALASGLLIALETGYMFAHDRVREGAYAMLGPSDRARIHRHIGYVLLAASTGADLDSLVFEIATHFNKAPDHATDPGERLRAAQLNLRAGRKARASAAYAGAADYLQAGREQLAEGGWREQAELTFALTLEHAECTFLDGNLAATRDLLQDMLSHVTRPVDLAAAYRLKVELHVVCTEHDEAVLAGLQALAKLGEDLPLHPPNAAVREEYDRVWTNLDGRGVQAFADLPPMEDPCKLAAMRLLSELWPPTYYTEFNLSALVICRMVNLSLVYGSAPSSNQGFALLGWLMGPVFHRFQEGLQLARMASDLAEQRHSALDQGRTLLTLAQTASWTQPLATVGVDHYRLARSKAIGAGDLYFACYCGVLCSSERLISGRGLAEEHREAKEYAEFATRLGFEDGAALTVTIERTFACLMGQTRRLSDFSDDTFDGQAFESGLTSSRMSVLLQWYWTRKTMLHYLAGEIASAVEASRKVYTGPWTRVVHIEHLEYHFYTALALCAQLADATASSPASLLQEIRVHRDTIRQWADESGSPTFTDKHLLIDAELARLEGRVPEAEALYEAGARAAKQNGFLQSAALAMELAGRFYRERGLEQVSRACLREAMRGYGRWGAQGKVKHMSACHPELLAGDPDALLTGTTRVSPSEVDLASVLKGSTAVASEPVLEQMISTLLRTVVQHAGAQRALLLRTSTDGFSVEAEAVTRGESVVVDLHSGAGWPDDVPEAPVRFVMRTRESFVAHDALADAALMAEAAVKRRSIRSVLCLPLGTAAVPQRVLYLENNLAPGVFTSAHLEVLNLLASQATISLENARQYADLARRESKIRRIFDTHAIGVVFWDFDGQLLDANDAFLRMVGHGRDELEHGALRWVDMTPPEWQAQIRTEVQELLNTGALLPVEKAFFHKNGTRVPILMSAATFEGSSHQGVAVIVDLGKQKEAETRALASERRNRLLQAELAHANRVATMGQLAAWIAHDVKQPLVSVVSSGQAALRWMDHDPPNDQAARRAIDRVIRDGLRAGDILDRVRALTRKTPPRAEQVDLNGVIADTVALVAPEAERKGIRVSTSLAGEPLLGMCDRVQMQQVLLNLLLNAMESVEAYANEAKELSVTSGVDAQGQLRMSVLDTGPGLSPADAEVCFQAFFTTKAEGLGMGLAICQSIVESFRGRIWCEPNAPRGAAFIITLPPIGKD